LQKPYCIGRDLENSYMNANAVKIPCLLPFVAPD
jgi:hypothetical protein